jgi:hypothetical protein
MEKYIVKASLLNIRSSAELMGPQNIITQLPKGKIVMANVTTNDWWKVDFAQNNKEIHGFAKAMYLEPAPIESQANNIQSVHYKANSRSKLTSVDARHCPLYEANTPQRDPHASSSAKVASMHAIVAALDVQNTSRHLRYAPVNNKTFCNIYAYDFCMANQAYLPRVWWTSKALIALNQQKAIDVVYGETVHELNANALFDWLNEWGDDFGWKRTFDLNELQAHSNDGAVGIICAKRQDTSRSGHIVAVLPEIASMQATRQSGHVTIPVQTQAGAKNKNRFNDNAWWLSSSVLFSGYGFWWHD